MPLDTSERAAVLPLALMNLPAHQRPAFLRKIDVALNGGPRGQREARKAAERLLGLSYARPSAARPRPSWAVARGRR